MTTAPTVDSGGVVTITNAQPAGPHTITIRATDNCGAFTDASFTLTVNAAPVFTIDSVSHIEGNVGTTTNFVFTITKTGASAVSSSVHVQTVDGTAVSTGGAFDFTALPDTTLTFPPSATTDTQTGDCGGERRQHL